MEFAMKTVQFFKMSACGNDFILIDNRQNTIDDDQASDFVQKACQRRIALGADGVIFLRNSHDTQSGVADFSMGFFNADGREVEMCGNGARCLARFAFLNGVCPERMTFETKAGLIEAEVTGSQVKLKMDYRLTPSPQFPLMVNGEENHVFFLKAGVPHAVYLVDDVEQADVIGVGRATRYHAHFQPQGTNANFVQVTGPQQIAIRTYERGVEDETLACGTGSIASTVICASLGKVVSPVSVVTRSGCILKVYYGERAGSEFDDIYLQGEARVVAEGNLWLDELSIEK
jgi:diaminopimelate epimerase